MLRDRIVMACALLILASMVLTAVPQHAAAASSSKELLAENAEEETFDEWNERWERFDLNAGDSQDYWCRSAHNLRDSAHAIYASRNGFNSHYLDPVTLADGTTGYTQGWNVNVTGLPGTTTPQSQWVQRYDTNQDAIMRKAVVGANEYDVVTLTFWFWSDTGHSDAAQPLDGSSVGFDFLNVLYWTNDGGTEAKHVAWTDSYEQATAKTWIHMSVEIPKNLTRIGFEFVSGTTAPDNGDATDAYASSGVKIVNGGMREGVYLDDIVLTGSGASAEEPTSVDTSVDNLATVQSSRTFNVGYVHTNPTVPFDHVNLYYRQGSSGDWLKYGGDYTASTIPFTATSDGRYEFFTQGFDANGGSEALAYAADAATIVDTVAPSTSISVTGTSIGTDAYSGSASFTLTAADGGSGTNSTYYRVDASSWIRYDGSAVTISNGGTHLIQYKSDDIAGNAEQMKSKSISVETTNPVVTFLEPSKTFTTSSATVKFQVTAGAAITELRASLDGADNFTVNPELTSVTFTDLASGTHRVTIWARDSDGRWGQNMTAFSVELSSPTNSTGSTDSGMILVLGSVSSSYKVGGTVHITWTCTIESGEIAKYLIKVDDNLVTQLGPETTSYDLKDLKAGSHVITVIAVDSTDNTTEQRVNVLVKDSGTGTGGISQDVLIVGGVALFVVVATVLLIYMRSRRLY